MTEHRPAYPAAERGPDIDDLAGRRVPDPYRWLESANDPRTVTWAREQDDLVGAHLAALPGREWIADRLRRLHRAGAAGVPVWRGTRAFHLRRDPRHEHAVLLVTEGTEERVLLDPMALDPRGTTTLDAWTPSHSGDRLAYQLSTGGDEESSLHVLDVATGARVDGPIDRCRYSPVAWLPGDTELFYVRRLPPDAVPAGEEQFHRRVWRHRLGTDPGTDTEVHGAGLDPTNYYDVHVSRDGRWLVVSASAGTAPRDDVWIAELTGRDAPVLRPVQVGVDARTSAWVARDGRLYLWTDRDAPNGRLCVADPTDAAHPWRDAVPESATEVLTDVALLDLPGAEGPRPVVLAAYSREASARLRLIDPAGGEILRAVTLPGVGTVSGVGAHPDGGAHAWIGYTDFLTAPQVLELDAADGATTVWARAPGAEAVPAVRVEEVQYPSADGTLVHMFVLHPDRPGSPPGPGPTVLYGYGGFDIALTPAYSPTTLAWVEAGGVWAVANLRGGSERGQAWHRAGMREHKQNVFDDFAAAGDYLIAAGVTAPGQLAVMGGSNGGLLVGATVTQRPDLVAAAVCSAPLLDMVRYELFGLGRTWNDEYGTATDPVELGWLLGYSPYHRVVAGTGYPAVLFTTFDSDTRVDPMHARKLCAALQHATAGPAPILLRREIDVGHGARSVSRTVDLATDQLAFLADRTGLQLPPRDPGATG